MLLSQRQVFFRKKLLQCSHTMRAVSLGQDRFRRRYWVLPHLGGVLVEGAEEILGEVQSNHNVFQILMNAAVLEGVGLNLNLYVNIKSWNWMMDK